jgi:flagellar hook assembly protein FlgD
LKTYNSYPNPFNSRTIITCRGMEGGDIEIYNIRGQLVKTITICGKEGQIIWDAADEAGNRVSSGVYFVRVRTACESASRKIVYLK